MPVSFNKRQQNEEAFCQAHSFIARACFPNVSLFPILETLLRVSCQFFVFKMQIMLTLHSRELIPACEHLQKFCKHEQVSNHLIFVSNSSKGQILRALSNWMGPFDTPRDGWYSWVRDNNHVLLHSCEHSLPAGAVVVQDLMKTLAYM